MTLRRLVSLDAVPVGSAVRVETGDLCLAVFNVDGVVHVLDDRCTHAEASLSEGEVFDDELECPRHGAIFDIVTGAAKTLPATRPVRVYPVTVDEGDVYVDVEEGR